MKLESWKRAEKRQIRAELRQLAKEERQRQQKAVQVRAHSRHACVAACAFLALQYLPRRSPAVSLCSAASLCKANKMLQVLSRGVAVRHTPILASWSMAHLKPCSLRLILQACNPSTLVLA